MNEDTGGVWLPIEGPVFVQVGQGLWRFTADRCELVGSDSGEDYPQSYRLCQRQPSVPQAGVAMPDGVGWYAFDGKWSDNSTEGSGEFRYPLRVEMYYGELMAVVANDYVPLTELVGTWTRLHMPWDAPRAQEVE